MPTYEYQCLKCEHRFELEQSFSAEPIAVCPVCRGVARRLFSAVPILFKGSGFYITDSRDDRKYSFDPKEPKGKKNEK
jgi:putative FmdB family regulatory protein